MENVIHYVGEKCTIMTDQQHRLVGISKVILQPACRFQIEVIRWLIQKQNVGATHQLPRQTKPSAFTTAQLFERLGAGFLRIETQSLQDGIHPWSESVSAFAIESLEVAIILGEHLRRGGLTHLRQEVGLFGKGKLEREQIRKLSCAGFPHCLGPTKVAVLLEEAETQTGLACDDPFGRLMRASNQAEESRLATSVPTEDPPAIAPPYGECYSPKDLRRTEFDTGIRD